MKRKVSKNRQELLENTINYFNSKNRGIELSNKENSLCFYYSDKTTKRCAIGIEVKKKTAMALQEKNKPIDCSSSFGLLPKRLQNMGKYFLRSIQELHDNHENWTKTELSLQGKEVVKDIKKHYNLK